MTQNKKIFQKGFLIITIRLLGVLLSFGTLMMITNLFPEFLVGKYQYLNSVLIVSGTIVLLGLNVSYIRFAGELIANKNYKELKHLYIKNIVIILGMTTAFVVLYYIMRMFLVPKFISEADDHLYQLALLALFPNCLSILNFQVILALRKTYLSETFRNVIKFSLIIVSILFFYFFGQVEQLLQAFVIALWILVIFSTYITLRNLNKITSSNETVSSQKMSYKKILWVSIPMTLSFISLLLMQQMDLLILKRYTDYQNIAYYGVAVKISMVLSIVLTAVNQLIGPQLAEFYFKKDQKNLKEIIEKSIILNNALTLPLIAIIVLMPETILSVFGSNYILAKDALIILLIGQALNAMMGSTDLYLNMTGKQNYFQKIIFIALIINVILNFVLIPQFGMTGAAIATAISLVFWNILGVIYIYRVDNIILIINFALIRKYIFRK